MSDIKTYLKKYKQNKFYILSDQEELKELEAMKEALNNILSNSEIKKSINKELILFQKKIETEIKVYQTEKERILKDIEKTGEYSEVLKMKYCDDMKIKKISEQLYFSESTVFKKINRAFEILEKLKAEINN